VEGQIRQISRLHAQVFECFGRFVNLLIDEFPFNLIGRVEDLPPQKLVQVISNRFEQAFWDVDVSSLFDDFFVDELGNLSHGVIGRSIKLESLTRRGVVECNLLESLTNVNSLPIVSKSGSNIVQATYVDRPKPFSHMIACEKVCDTSKLVQKVIFEAKKGRHSDNGSLRIKFPCYSFRLSL
jgi:hypothetical protein